MKDCILEDNIWYKDNHIYCEEELENIKISENIDIKSIEKTTGLNELYEKWLKGELKGETL